MARLTRCSRRLRLTSASLQPYSKSCGTKQRCTKPWKPTTTSKLLPPPSRPSMTKLAAHVGSSTASSSTCRKMVRKCARCASIMRSAIHRLSCGCFAQSLWTSVNPKTRVLSRTKGRKKTGPNPIKHGMTARGGTLRTGNPHPARGAGTDSPP